MIGGHLVSFEDRHTTIQRDEDAYLKKKCPKK